MKEGFFLLRKEKLIKGPNLNYRIEYSSCRHLKYKKYKYVTLQKQIVIVRKSILEGRLYSLPFIWPGTENKFEIVLPQINTKSNC
jgi:hypothetical protein